LLQVVQFLFHVQDFCAWALLAIIWLLSWATQIDIPLQARTARPCYGLLWMMKHWKFDQTLGEKRFGLYCDQCSFCGSKKCTSAPTRTNLLTYLENLPIYRGRNLQYIHVYSFKTRHKLDIRYCSLFLHF
jgi:hypothetical protein